MDEKKIAFIICTNNEQWYRECEKYINELEVSLNMSKVIVPITNAESMASGYNEGMKKTDAKYKIYMHQDTFIIRKDFLKRVVELFLNHPEVGIMGVLGTDSFVQDASYWDHWSLGQVYAFDIMRGYRIQIPSETERDITYGLALDGMILMTQYDVTWREDIFKEWDFYDVSQCFEFIKNGYKVAIMHESEISCLHDCGYSKLTKYDENREIFTQEYQTLGFEYNTPYTERLSEEWQTLADNFLQCLDKILLTDIEQACQVIEKVYPYYIRENRISTLKLIKDIYIRERQAEIHNSFMQVGCTWKGLIDYYTKYKFMIRRIEFSLETNVVDELIKSIRESKISILAVEEIIKHCCIEQGNVIRAINTRLAILNLL